MKIRHAYSPSEPQHHPKCGKTMTEQHHEKHCNINNIMAKYQKTGLIDHVKKHGGTYGDVTGQEFKEAQDLIASQKSIFYELPSSVRDQLGNDPANYLNLVMTDEGVGVLNNLLHPERSRAVQEEKSQDQKTEETEKATEESSVT